MKPEIIVALDYSELEPVKGIVESVGDAVNWYKVGLELFVSCGPDALSYLADKGKKVFLDLKFHDIPNTVSKVCLSSLKYGVSMMNMHVQGGEEMMKTAVDKVSESAGDKRPLMLGVTVLTSLDENHLSQYGIVTPDTASYVLKLAEIAKRAGMDGVVSSAKETQIIKENLGEDFITVTPGIRPASASVDDQKRVVTPADARQMGTDYIVVGRPITKADNPKEAAEAIKEEMGWTD
ncbi:orotidine-5'-phosphate decarboxylase [Limisalsivibrio acetivorans]|uniref:orotidine-5'-phosphate decarboxylase n=1 Tax=Limisalsivibrio acetivorans TaxID=1304888 RepID=UPI0003B39B12|nr:orotidine-5'-phosphate decarboxylase [Limisalsivibrio acetivorans]